MGQKRFKLSVQSQKKVLNENLKEVPNTNYRCGLGYSLTVRLKIIDYNSRNKDQIAIQQKISDSNEIKQKYAPKKFWSQRHYRQLLQK